MLCQDIMRRPVECATRGTTVQVVARTMRDRNIGFMPVCDAQERVVGVITDRDIAVRICADDRAAADTPVEEIMSRSVVSCHAYDQLHIAERLMANRHKSRILILDDDRRPIGVISLSDLASRATTEAAETLREIASREIAPQSRPPRPGQR